MHNKPKSNHNHSKEKKNHLLINKKKFKSKYDSRIHLIKQRTIQQRRAEFVSRTQKQKTNTTNRTETIQLTSDKPKAIPNAFTGSSDNSCEQPFSKLDRDVSVEKISSVKSHSIRPNKKPKSFTVDNKSENDKSNQQYNLENSTSNLYSSNNTREVWFDDVPQALIANSLQDQSATTKSLVKLTSFAGPTRRIAMDCEFVGVGFEGKDDALARVSIVNQFGHTLLDTYVRPEERVVDYRTKVSGIRPRDLRKNGSARPFNDVHKEVAELIKNKILVGHSILKDLKVLRLSHPRRFIRDTSRYRPFRDLFNGRIPSLKALTQKVLGVNVQSGEHDSIEDARATMRLYTSVKRVWESSKKHRTSKTKEVKKNENLEEQGVLSVKDEYESGLQEVISSHNSQQQSTTSTNVKYPIHKSKQWDPIRNRKCSKNRMKFLNRRRKNQKNVNKKP
uniref:RNA exonuclease 4 n=1 Tax=Schistosoma mansoni TaxID=6183 RepID=A0A5K4EZK0_SCHMA